MNEEDAIRELTGIEGVGKSKAQALHGAGFKSIQDIQKVTIDDLTAVEGIGGKLAEKIKEAVGAPVKKAEKKDVKKAEKKDVKKAEKKKTAPAKTKPKTDEKTRLLKLKLKQKEKKPAFRRHDSHKKKRIKDSWRKPRGLHNKLRRHIKAKGALVKSGYGSPRAVRGLHHSGLEEVMVYNLGGVEQLEPERYVLRISSGVGLRKRLMIQEKASELGLKVLNPATVVAEEEKEESEE